ncbi:hypothetical protein PQO03_09260 [Lentisphaera profundi]|uniref:B box-type domain-containing protein n=1 Tax=Lentisphaera profundi TaxID=1658616 RepID=A0ABY7VRP4_9BACT|nr:hypothetical protein [Lentisphaera profundi]WDE95903.1 hypothetical protein PQO03_09260 [Lentisphaera profundi]
MNCKQHPNNDQTIPCLACKQDICALCKNSPGKVQKLCTTCLQQELSAHDQQLNTKVKAKLSLSLALLIGILVMAYYYAELSSHF